MDCLKAFIKSSNDKMRGPCQETKRLDVMEKNINTDVSEPPPNG
jgi:hypothetical protein